MATEEKKTGGLEVLKPQATAKLAEGGAISLFDDDDERTEIAPFAHDTPSVPAHPVKAISLEDDDEDRTVIDKKPPHP